LPNTRNDVTAVNDVARIESQVLLSIESQWQVDTQPKCRGDKDYK
jgi:hypothetical protein